MVTILENLLYEKTQGRQSEILYAQWKYDKRIVPDALQSVSTLFPHYSLHDESHSITIINNIVRILGEGKLRLLSAIDIWLILEASYWHDIGMVVSFEKIEATIKSADFNTFYKDILSDDKNTLFEFANLFKLTDGKFHYKGSEFSFEYHDGFRFLLAEFFRRSHASRSKNIITSPDSELMLSTPRGVIPDRINRILGEICACHTKNFEDVLNLPFKEVGIDTEDAHPRFISCLLRLGDLLDLDNNRFSDVMLRTLSKVPLDTINHKNKHLAIQHFRVDNEKVEVTAKCNGYDVASITQHWFNYIHSEFGQQMLNWNRIVPFQEFGFLPSVGNLIVDLEGYEYLDGKNKPKFVVDSTKALELLSGAGIYESKFQAIREILQNSIDATLQRVWLDHDEILKDKTPQSDEFKALVKGYPISIEIKEQSQDAENKIWLIKIQDNGTGLSKFDLNFLINTGTSFKNYKKNRLVDSMPKWLQPSGIFGIGFQSIFMLTDQVKIKTKSYFTEESKTIELSSPKSSKDGAILIQNNKTNHKEEPGTTLSFCYITRRLPNTWKYSDQQSNIKRAVDNYDPFVNDSMDVDIAYFLDELFKFSSRSYLPIKVKLNHKELSIHNSIQPFKYYDQETNIELDVRINPSNNESANLYFKNQRIVNEDKYSYFLKFLSFDINLHGEKATDVLSLNRNVIKKDRGNYILQKSLKAIYRILLEKFNEVLPEEKDKQIGSLFLHYYKKQVPEFHKLDKFTQWSDYEIFLDDKETNSKKLGELTSFSEVKISCDNKVNETKEYFREEGGTLIIKIQSEGNYSNIQSFIVTYIFKNYTVSNVEYRFEDSVKEITLVKVKPLKDHDVFQEKDFKTIFNLNKSTRYYSRFIIPCLSKYEKLRVKSNCFLEYTSEYYILNDFNLDYPKMVSPFVRYSESAIYISKLKVEINERLFQWVHSNRFDTLTTLEDIEEGYKHFIDEFEPYLNKDS